VAFGWKVNGSDLERSDSLYYLDREREERNVSEYRIFSLYPKLRDSKIIVGPHRM
jgi:hypothetical protein